MSCFPRKFATLLVVLTSAITMSFSNQASAEVFGGIDFPDGVSSFADSVITYDCNFGGGLCPAEAFQDPTLALGNPDLDDPVKHFVSLGTFGLLEVAFVDNRLTNSGDALHDLYIFEQGTDVEGTLVAVRPTAATELILDASIFDANADGFYEVGSVFGGIASVDIDSFFTGYASGELVFDAVQLIDEFGETGPTLGTHGADITAVGAISSELNPSSIVDVTYDSPVIDFGPLSFGLAELPAEPEVTFLLGDGTPAVGEVTSYGLSDVLSADLIFGDVVIMNDIAMTSFAMEVDAGGVTTALSYAFALPDTPTAAGSIVLNFPFTVTGTVIASGDPFSYTYANSEVTITPVPGPGDFNGDLIVDGADFLKWQREDGTPASLLEWEANYGNDYALAAVTAVTAAVPEPSGLALIAVGLLGMGARRRKQA